jgi:hypothetical protein
MRVTKKQEKRIGAGMRTAKDCALLAVFIAILISAQLVLSTIPGVEVVTVLFVSFAFVAGWKKSMFVATAFSLLRQLIFGIFPVVLVLYLIYYNLLAVAFGVLGRKIREPNRWLFAITALACVGTICFNLLDNILTPLWYGYSAKALKVYFMASLPVMFSQTICTAVSVFLLFLPLFRVFNRFFT